MSKAPVYDKLCKSIPAYPGKSKIQLQLDVNRIWNENKKLENGVSIILDIIKELNNKASKRSLVLKNFWTNIPLISFKKADTATDTTATDATISDATASDAITSDATARDATASDATSIVNVSKPNNQRSSSKCTTDQFLKTSTKCHKTKHRLG